MSMYRPVPRVPDFAAIERDILRFWEGKRIFQELREQMADGTPWSFLDGPITVNNPMGVHHAWGRSLKDMYQRYHAMNGRALRYQNGFDRHGLWVEVEVEKSLGLSRPKLAAERLSDEGGNVNPESTIRNCESGSSTDRRPRRPLRISRFRFIEFFLTT